jgi:hypothetical protein
LSALALLPRFSAALPSAGLLGRLDAAGADSFIHRDYAALFASVPAIAIGSIAFFVLKDHLAATASRGIGTGASATGAGAFGAGAGAGDVFGAWLAADGQSLRPDEELALAGIVLVAMAERLEHDPAAYPLLACAAARLVPELAGAAGWRGWTGLTERARRAAVEVLRPTALSVLVRAATWALLPTGEEA